MYLPGMRRGDWFFVRCAHWFFLPQFGAGKILVEDVYDGGIYIGADGEAGGIAVGSDDEDGRWCVAKAVSVDLRPTNPFRQGLCLAAHGEGKDAGRGISVGDIFGNGKKVKSGAGVKID